MVEIISNNVVVLCDVLLWIVFHYIFNKVFDRKMKEYRQPETATNLTES
jgi:hypothetical protein